MMPVYNKLKLSLRLIYYNTLKFQDELSPKTGQNSALQSSLFWRYANFSKLIPTLHTSMASTFQCEYCQHKIHTKMYDGHQFGKISTRQNRE